MTDKELEVRNKCRDICNRNNKEKALTLIKQEFSGCCVSLSYHYGKQGMNEYMYMGMIMWQDISISF